MPDNELLRRVAEDVLGYDTTPAPSGPHVVLGGKEGIAPATAVVDTGTILDALEDWGYYEVNIIYDEEEGRYIVTVRGQPGDQEDTTWNQTYWGGTRVEAVGKTALEAPKELSEDS